MSDEAWDRLGVIFHRAVELPVADRATWLDSECGTDPSLRAEIDAMLAAHGDGGSDAPESLLAHGAPGARLGPGDRLGAYRLEALIGRGGMGEVYRARREDENYRQEVAIKLVRAERSSPELVRRFVQERQILAQLTHPNIATLLDGGLSQQGAPYLVMQFVEGVPLTRYAKDQGLGLDARLRLFATVCDAVQFAHQHLVIHRDIKPANILVGQDGQPRLLDFGIAKLVDGSADATELPAMAPALPGPDGPGMTDPAEAPTADAETGGGLGDAADRFRTDTGRRLLTPEYAAPEQLAGRPATTATDIYQLGGLLFELLTDGGPHAANRRADSPIVPPSTRLTGTAARAVAGDLDAIVAKATAIDPGHRYRSVNELAADIGRYRQGFPILARPATARYRFGKLIRRHRLAAWASLAAVVVLSGLAVTIVRSVQRIATERGRTEQVGAMLAEMFAAADPLVVPGDTLTVVAQLDRGAGRVMANPSLDPVVRARLLAVIARAYENLGRPADALPLRERIVSLWREARPPADAERLGATRALAQLLAQFDSTDRAVAVADEALAAARTLPRDRRAELATAFNEAGFVRHRAGRYAEARPYYEQAEAVARDLPDSVAGRSEILINLAGLAANRSEPAVAESLFRLAYGLRQRLRGTDDPTTARAALHLAAHLTRNGNVAEAQGLIDSAIAIQRRTFPGATKDLAYGLSSKAGLLAVKGRFAEAAALQRESIEATKAVVGERSSDLAPAIASLATYLQRSGALDEAALLHREALARYESMVGRWHQTTGVVGTNLAITEALRRRPAVAESLYRVYLPVLDSTVPGSRLALQPKLDFVWAMRRNNRCRDAEGTARAVVEGLANRPPADVDRIRARRLLGECLMDLGRYPAAESLLVDAHRSLVAGFGERNPFTAAAAADLDTLYRRWKRRAGP